ncbi:hypothetical protein [Amycolatopsis sp. WAC 04197]|uniref:hypothetical protein n=1 Tax=Amycolatopsis sp. WAC 04197 TaxID=2203199 RepID=UPI000F7A95FE|nr:hypothetical protein [Amycolatopsis sp. WAC 04197]
MVKNHEPKYPFRILRTAKNVRRVSIPYDTREARDAAGSRYAEQDAARVLLEFWSETHPQDPLNEGWACDGHVDPPGAAPAGPLDDASALLTRIRDALMQIDDAAHMVEDADRAGTPGDEHTARERREALLDDLVGSVDVLDKLLSEGGALPGAWSRRSTKKAVTYAAVTPDVSDVCQTQAGAKLGPMVLQGVEDAKNAGVYHCRWCSNAFNRQQQAVLARHPDEDELHGFHEACAGDFALNYLPIVVTVRPDRTAQVTGPPNTSVTVLIED